MQVNQLPQIPVVVERETTAKDVAQILKAADSSKRSLSAVEYSEVTPTFKMMPQHIGAAAAVVMVAISIVAYAFTGMLRYAVGFALCAGLAIGLYLFFVSVYHLNSTKHYFVEYASDQSQSQKTIRLEVHQDRNRINYVDLPSWVMEGQLITLAHHAQQRRGFVFNREHCNQAGICTYRQWPELRDSFLRASLAAQSGRQFTLTDSFFTLADSLQEA